MSQYKYIEAILQYGSLIAKKLFGAEYADLRPISGHTCAMTALMALAKTDDSIMSLGLGSGDYLGYIEGYLPSRLCLHVHEVPFDKDGMRIALEGLVASIHEVRPRLVVIAPSMIIFSTPLRKIARACRGVGSKLIYDGSHVLGLIAGNAFSNPLHEGANVLLGSTHKSFPGPQGGIILSDEEHSTIGNYIPLRIVDNPHFNRIAAMIMAMEEMTTFGKPYVRQVVANARALARALDNTGIEVLGKPYGYTETHQVLLKPFHESNSFMKSLQQANIIIDSALKLETYEVTRKGMKEQKMRYVAELIAKIYHARNKTYFKTQILKVRKEIENLASKYSKIIYSLESL